MKKNILNEKYPLLRSFLMPLAFTLASGFSAFSQVQVNDTVFIADQTAIYIASGEFSVGDTGSMETTKSNNYGKLMLDEQVTFAVSADSKFIDGFVSSTSTKPFIMNVGQKNVWAPLQISEAATSDGVDGAFFKQAPATTTLDASVSKISSVGYWAVKGADSKISLSYNAAIVDGLTDYYPYFIAGFDGTDWKKIPSTVDTISFLDNECDANSGSITTTDAVNLSTYSLFTIASYSASLNVNTFDAAKTITFSLNNNELRFYANQEISNIQIYDLSGKLIATQASNAATVAIPFYYAQGLYIAKVKLSNNTMATVKLMQTKL